MTDKRMIRLFAERDEEVLREVMIKYGDFCLAIAKDNTQTTGEAEEWFTEKVADMKWKPEDHVENKLKNLANALVYEQIMKGESCLWISSEQLQEALNLQTEPETEPEPEPLPLPDLGS